jgi:hypothetical protein
VKRLLTLVGAIATLAAGVTAAVALGAGSSSPDTATGTTTVTTAPDTATDTTTITTAPDTTTDTTTITIAPDTTTGTTAIVAAGATTNSAPSKIWVCHHTGSWKHPYHLIHISAHALPAHMNHGDVRPGADNPCPTQPANAKTHGRGNEQSSAKTKHDNPGKGDDKTDTNDD